MNTQLTIRNLPEPINYYLRKKAKLNNKSLNQTIIDELSEKVPDFNKPFSSSLSWFIGSGLDDDTLEALRSEDRLQKEKVSRENDLL